MSTAITTENEKREALNNVINMIAAQYDEIVGRTITDHYPEPDSSETIYFVNWEQNTHARVVIHDNCGEINCVTYILSNGTGMHFTARNGYVEREPFTVQKNDTPMENFIRMKEEPKRAPRRRVVKKSA